MPDNLTSMERSPQPAAKPGRHVFASIQEAMDGKTSVEQANVSSRFEGLLIEEEGRVIDVDLTGDRLHLSLRVGQYTLHFWTDGQRADLVTLQVDERVRFRSEIQKATRLSATVKNFRLLDVPPKGSADARAKDEEGGTPRLHPARAILSDLKGRTSVGRDSRFDALYKGEDLEATGVVENVAEDLVVVDDRFEKIYLLTLSVRDDEGEFWIQGMFPLPEERVSKLEPGDTISLRGKMASAAGHLRLRDVSVLKSPNVV